MKVSIKLERDGFKNVSVSKPVSFFRTSWDKVPDVIFEKCARLYCGIWKEPPWNEDFWQPTQVLENMQTELKKQGADGFIAYYIRGLSYCEYENHHNLSNIPTPPSDEARSIVIGFTWGYPVNREELREISGSDCLGGLFVSEDRVFYIDELAVASQCRDSNVGTELNRLLIKSAKGQGFKTVVLRTDKKAVAARNLYLKAGFADLKIEDAVYPNRTYWRLKL